MFNWLFGPILVSKVDRLSTYAAALAYCFVLSLIPFLVVTFTLGSQLAPKNVDLGTAYRELLSGILPMDSVADSLHAHDVRSDGPASPAEPTDVARHKDDVTRVANLPAQIVTTLQSSSHRGLATVGFIFAVYTSFNLMEQIVRTLLFIFDDPRRPQEWTWYVILKTIALLCIWMFLLFLISVVSVITPVIHNILDQLQLASGAWTAPLLIGRDMGVMAALFGAFFLTYLLVPTRRPPWGQVRDGALVASCGWVFCSLIFAYVLPTMWRANAVYEALGSVVVILLWAQACAWSVILGACWIVRFSPRAKR